MIEQRLKIIAESLKLKVNFNNLIELGSYSKSHNMTPYDLIQNYDVKFYLCPDQDFCVTVDNRVSNERRVEKGDLVRMYAEEIEEAVELAAGYIKLLGSTHLSVACYVAAATARQTLRRIKRRAAKLNFELGQC